MGLCKKGGGGGSLTTHNVPSLLLYLVTDFFGWGFLCASGFACLQRTTTKATGSADTRRTTILIED